MKSHYTIAEVSEWAGVSRATITNWEQLHDVARPELARFRELGIQQNGWIRVYTAVEAVRISAVAVLVARGLPVHDAVAGADDLVVEWWRFFTGRAEL